MRHFNKMKTLEPCLPLNDENNSFNNAFPDEEQNTNDTIDNDPKNDHRAPTNLFLNVLTVCNAGLPS